MRKNEANNGIFLPISLPTCPHFWRQFLHCQFQPCKLCSPPSVQSISVNFSMSKHISMSINWLNHLHHHFCLFHGCPRHFHLPFHPALFSSWPASARFLLKSEWWPSSVEQLRLTTNRFEILATVKLTVVDINIPSTRKIGILSRNEFQTLCTFVNVTHFCIALLSNVVLVVVCVVAVVCKSPLEMAIASLLQD